MNLKKFRFLLNLIGVVLFIYVLYKQDLKTVWNIILDSNYYLLALSLLIYPIIIFFKTFRMYLISSKFAVVKKIEFMSLYKSYMESYFWGALTPGKIGEFSRVFFINKHIDSKLKSLSLVIFDRIIDLIIVFEIGVLSIIYICFKTGYFSFGQAVLYSILSAALFFISWLLIKTPKFIIEFIIKKLNFFLNKIAEKILNISESFRQFNYFDIMIWNFITVISWLCYFFQAFLISRSVNLDISYFTVIAVISISSIIAILPISTAGIGPREFTIINILKYFDITSETAFSFSIMFLITIYLSVFSGHLSALFFIKSK